MKIRAKDGPMFSDRPPNAGIRHRAGSIGDCSFVVAGCDPWGDPAYRCCERVATWETPDGRVYCTQHFDLVARDPAAKRRHLRVAR